MPPDPAEHTVTLYTRLHCGLCEEAEEELRVLSGELGFVLVAIDIDGDAALLGEYTDIVPLVALDGAIIAHAPIADGELRRALAAAGLR